MANFWKSVKINILLGYITLVFIALATVWVIYNETLALTDSQFDVNPVNNKTAVVNILFFITLRINAD